MNSDPAKQAWQASVEIAGAPPLDLVRKGAGRLYRGVWIRNAIEYAACVAILIFYVPQMFTVESEVRRLGAFLIVLGVAFVAWQLHHRASADHPDKAGTMPILQFARAQLVRQRDALAGVLWWYLLPIAPGLAVNLLANTLDHVAQGTGTLAGGLLPLAGMMALFFGIWSLNQRGARKLQKHIDEIDALTGEKE